mgnify:CR=1 FL=1
MFLFGNKKKKEVGYVYDPKKERPILYASICTGETTAGFRNLETNKYTEVMLIRSDEDLLQFCNMYGLKKEEIPREF